MNLNPNGKIARFYLYFNAEPKLLPENFCTYFWGLFARCLAVLGAGVFLTLGLYGLILWLLFIASVLWSIKLIMLVLLAMTLILLLARWIAKKDVPEVIQETRTIIRGKVDSVKNRYCPRINWKETK